MTFLVHLSFLAFLLETCEMAPQCKSIQSVYGKYLKNHVMSRSTVADLMNCTITCDINPKCKSWNFRLHDKECELNEADRFTHTQDYQDRAGHIYCDTAEPLNGKSYKSCAEVKRGEPESQSGYYWIKIKDKELQVYCDMDKYGTFRVEDFTNTTKTVFYKIPSGVHNFNSSCRYGTCPRIIISYSYPNVWESNCKGVQVGYKIASFCHSVFDGHDNSECPDGKQWESTGFYGKRILYGYPCPGNDYSSQGLYKDQQGLLFVK